MIAKRGPLRINGDDLVGGWRTTRGGSSKFWNLAQDGSLTGRVVEGNKVTEAVVGTWNVEDDCLVFDYGSDLSRCDTFALYQDRSVIMEITRDHLITATGETTRVRYARVS